MVSGLSNAKSAPVDTHPLRYAIGKVKFVEMDDEVKIRPFRGLPLSVAVDGGRWKPPLLVNDAGQIFLSNYLIDSESGVVTMLSRNPDIMWLDKTTSVSAGKNNSILIRHKSKLCRFSASELHLGSFRTAVDSFKNNDFYFAKSNTMVVGLLYIYDEDGNAANYTLVGINPNNCKLNYREAFGHPDLFVELAWTKNGGWWITGSIEQTLMQSKDGVHWTVTHLPADIHGLVSSYVQNHHEIWLAAGTALSDWGAAIAPMLYSADAGKTWVDVQKNSRLLNLLPKYWVQGLRGAAGASN
jgi:hypothetical protein